MLIRLFIILPLLVVIQSADAARFVFLHASHVRQENGKFGEDLLVREIFRQSFLRVCRERYGLITHDAVLGSRLKEDATKTLQYDVLMTVSKTRNLSVQLLELREGDWTLCHEHTLALEEGSSAFYLKLIEAANTLSNGVWSEHLEDRAKVARRHPRPDEITSVKPRRQIDFFGIFQRLRALHGHEIQGSGEFDPSAFALEYANLYQETQHQSNGGSFVYLARALIYGAEHFKETATRAAQVEFFAVTGLHELALKYAADLESPTPFHALLHFDWEALNENSPTHSYLATLIGRRHPETAYHQQNSERALSFHPLSARVANSLYTRLGRKRSRIEAQLQSLLHQTLPRDPALRTVLDQITTEHQTNPNPEKARPMFLPQADLENALHRMSWNAATAGVPAYSVLARQVAEQRVDYLMSFNFDPNDYDARGPYAQRFLAELSNHQTHPAYPRLVFKLPEVARPDLLDSWVPGSVGFYDMTSGYSLLNTKSYKLAMADRHGSKTMSFWDAFYTAKRCRVSTYFELTANYRSYFGELRPAIFQSNPYDPENLKEILEREKNWKAYWTALPESLRAQGKYRSILASKAFEQLDYPMADNLFEELSSEYGPGNLPPELANLKLSIELQSGNPDAYLNALEEHLRSYAKGLEKGFTRLKMAEVYWETGKTDLALEHAKIGAESWARYALLYTSMIHLMSGDESGAWEYQTRNFKNYGNVRDLAYFHILTGRATEPFLASLNVDRAAFEKAIEDQDNNLAGMLRYRDWEKLRKHLNRRKDKAEPVELILLASLAQMDGDVSSHLESLEAGLARNEARAEVDAPYYAEMHLLRAVVQLIRDNADNDETVKRLQAAVDRVYLRQRCEVATLAGVYAEAIGAETAALDFYKQACRPRAAFLDFVDVAFARLLEAGVPLSTCHQHSKAKHLPQPKNVL